MVARFLHYYPQYSLSDLRDGTLGYGEFIYLLGGMFDVEDPTVTESVQDKIARRTRELARQVTGRVTGRA